MKKLAFNPDTYRTRRTNLIESINEGVVLLPGNLDSPMNYEDNTYPFRQDSNFLYFAGIDHPDLIMTIDAESGKSILFGDDYDINMIVWTGKVPTLQEMASWSGIDEVRSKDSFSVYLNQNPKVHFLPPYRAERKLRLSKWLSIQIDEVDIRVSKELVHAVIALRVLKSDEEIRYMEDALDITHSMHTTVMRTCRPGMTEAEVNAQLRNISNSQGCLPGYPCIVTNRGHILHNHTYTNTLKDGDLLLIDAGSDNVFHYAADITRTIPVAQTFTAQQKIIYQIVLDALNTSIELIKPHESYRDIHLHAAKVIAQNLVELGLMRGDPEEAVMAGAHALFFPHGLGHMIGLDVHDMEDLGENLVGYDEQVHRSTQFGTRSLRLGRTLHAGFVLTVEPGIYFIPDLIDLWKSEGKFNEFIDYNEVNKFRDFTGIRIEDNVLVTENGYRILGPPIPKEIIEIESLRNS